MKLHNIRVENKLIQNKARLGKHKRLNPTAFKGYPGLKHTAKEICEYIPKCKIFVEPFAGLGRISKLVNADTKILNDLSDYSVIYLKKHFKNSLITQLDFQEVIKKYNTPETVIFIDPPWFEEVYSINPLTVSTMKPKEYYLICKDLLEDFKGIWFVVSNAEGYAKLLNGYSKEVQSKKGYLFGHKARTLIVSNKPLIMQRQLTFDTISPSHYLNQVRKEE